MADEEEVVVEGIGEDIGLEEKYAGQDVPVNTIAYNSDDNNEEAVDETVYDAGASEDEDYEEGEDYEEDSLGDEEDDEEYWKEVRQDAVQGTESQIRTIDELIKRMKKPESEQDKHERERRERSKRIISAVGDGLSALSNLYFTTQYAPDMYKGSNLTETTNSQIEKARQEREKNDEAYFNYVMKKGDLLGQKAKAEREVDALRYKQDLDRQKADNDQQISELTKELLGEKITGQKETNRGKAADADKKETQAAHEEQNQKDKHSESESRTNKNNRMGHGRSGGSSRRRRGRKGSSGGGSDEVTTTTTYDSHGNVTKTTVRTKNNGKGTGGSAKSQVSIHK